MNISTVQKTAQSTNNIADEAMRMAKEYQLAPTPITYEVWYVYVSGDNPELNAHLDEILKTQDEIGQYDFEVIHQKYLDNANRQMKNYDDASGKLSSHMDGILDVIQNYMTSSEEFSGSLEKNMEALNGEPKADQILDTIKNLVEENANMRSSSAELMKNLNESKQQVEEMQQSLQESRENEMKDALTSMYNRRYFDISLENAITEAREEGSPLCLAMADIDYFKKLNDRYGHLIGDEVLRFVSSLIIKNVKGQDTAARYGGEEFAVILPATEIANAQALMDSIRTKMESTNLVLSKSKQTIGKITASFGIAQLQEGENPLDLIERADANLYKAKEAGRNCIIC